MRAQKEEQEQAIRKMREEIEAMERAREEQPPVEVVVPLTALRPLDDSRKVEPSAESAPVFQALEHGRERVPPPREQ